jgi:hypothetical protein
MDNNDAVDKYTDSGYKNNVISFRLAICGSMETRATLGYSSDITTLWKLKVLARDQSIMKARFLCDCHYRSQV